MSRKYILIALISIITIGGILVYWSIVKREIPPEGIPNWVKCPLWHKKIERAFEEANFCERDADCKAIGLGGLYIEFGCFKFVNILTDENELLRQVAEYDKRCGQAINKCVPVPEASCHSKKCISIEEIERALILFEKQEGWGPCPPNAICEQLTKLYYSGELILEGEKNIKKQLETKTIEKIKNQIKASGIMNKDCSAKTLPDYWATYVLNLDGQTKTIRFPGCEKELREIEDLINF